jgi:PmbA protein
MGGEFDFSHELRHLDVGKVARLGAETALELLGSKNPPTMRCPAILRNNVVSELIEFMAGSFSAEQIDKGRSLLAGKQGKQVFSPLMNLIDDGLLPGGYATGPFDGEGVPARKTALVTEGVFSHALYDLYYARKHKTDSTGSAMRGIKGPPSIGFSNLFLEPGKKPLNDLIKQISKGILIVDLMGVHTANPVTGDFSLGASGILIENGKLTRPARGFAVAGNILGLFKSLTEIGNDLRFFGNVGAPSICIEQLSVGGT